VRWVLYNFSAETVTGKLDIGGEDGVASMVGSRMVTLAPGERLQIVDQVGTQAQVLVGRKLKAIFVPDDVRVPRAVFVTRLLPTDEWMVSKPVAGFDFPAKAANKHRALLAARKTADGEPGLRADGRWLVTDGLRVEEKDGVWRFHIDHLPAEPLIPAIAELPLPEGFDFGPGMFLSMERRKVEAVVGKPASGEGPTAAQLKSRAGVAGDMLTVAFRAKNGNLYQTWPRSRVMADWAKYREQSDNFTMSFFSRAELPWRFFDNRPTALVFVLRASKLPAVFEVRGAQIERIGRENFFK
jgi:hypothetical protein